MYNYGRWTDLLSQTYIYIIEHSYNITGINCCPYYIHLCSKVFTTDQGRVNPEHTIYLNALVADKHYITHTVL